MARKAGSDAKSSGSKSNTGDKKKNVSKSSGSNRHSPSPEAGNSAESKAKASVDMTKSESESHAEGVSPCLRGFGPPELQPLAKKKSTGPKPFFVPTREEFQWKKKIVTVSFFDSAAAGIPGIEDEVMKIASRWSDKILLKLSRSKDNDPSADIRVTFKGPGQYFSLIGTQSKQGTAPSMNLGFRPGSQDWTRPEERRRLVLHEFGHALGLHHEHKLASMGLKMAEVVNYYAPRLPGYTRSQIESQFTALSENEIDPKFKEFTKNPDPDSIMMYEFPANLSTTFPQGIKGGNDFSPKDLQGIVKLYGEEEKYAPGPQGLELVVDSPTKQAYWLFGKDKGLFHFLIKTPGEFEIVVSSETLKDDPKIVDPFASIPLPFQPHLDIFKLGTHFELFPPDDKAPNSKGKAPLAGMGFNVEVPDEITEGMDDTIFVRPIKFEKKGLYFLEVTNATADVAKNDVSRFIVTIRRKKK
jgi:hypothetical protein